MQINSPGMTALQGMMSGMQSMNKNAHSIATAPATPAAQNQQTEAVVGLMGDQHQVQASAKAFKAADDMIGSLLDIMA